MSKEFKVGLFALIAGVILYLGFNFLKGVEVFSNTNKYYAIYNNVDGLNVSNPVIVNGFSVGRVSKIRILQDLDNKVLVELSVTEELALGENTIATLTNSDFLGSKAIVLSIGKISVTRIDGDTIVAKVDKGLAAILDDAKPITTSLATTIVKVNEFLTDLEGIGGKLKASLDGFEKGMNNFNGILEENSNSLKITLSNFATASSELKVAVKKLSPILSNVDSLTSKINTLELEKTITSLNKTLAEVSVLMEGINQGNGSFGKLMKEDSLYNNLNTAILNLDKLLIHFNENPKHFMAPLGRSKKKIARELEKGK